VQETVSDEAHGDHMYHMYVICMRNVVVVL